eukprot:2729818-Prymnesium_polylepis.1
MLARTTLSSCGEDDDTVRSAKQIADSTSRIHWCGSARSSRTATPPYEIPYALTVVLACWSPRPLWMPAPLLQPCQPSWYGWRSGGF